MSFVVFNAHKNPLNLYNNFFLGSKLSDMNTKNKYLKNKLIHKKGYSAAGNTITHWSITYTINNLVINFHFNTA